MDNKYQQTDMSQEKNLRSLFFRVRLAALIEERGISQRQLADGTKLTPQSISNYVRGARDVPRAEELYALSKYFGVTMESFLDMPSDSDGVGEGNAGHPSKWPNPKVERAVARLEEIVDRLRSQIEELKKSVGYVGKSSPKP